MKTKTIKKRKFRVAGLFYLLFLGLFSFSLFHILIWASDSFKANKEIKKISKTTKINIIQDDDNIVIPETNLDYYHLYKDVQLIDVDFSNLLSINNSTKGWIKVNDTNINYPFVQHSDNKYYLNHTFNKKSNGGGWLFLDYRNSDNFEDFNTIIYGHGRKDKTIFGTLGNVLKEDYLKKPSNKYIMISTQKKDLTYEIFSAYKTPNTSDYIKTFFSSDKEKEDFIKLIKSRNSIKIDVQTTTKDKILTLSTCYNNDIKIVVHAKLVKYLER